MDAPPSFLDGAVVLYWAQSPSDRPFSYRERHGRRDIALVGLAIASYSDANNVYLFECDHNWRVHADTVWGSVDEAMAAAEDDLGAPRTDWMKTDS